MVDKIIHLEERKLTLYTGGYDRFEQTRAERIAQTAAAANKQAAQRAPYAGLRRPLPLQGQQGAPGPEPPEDAGQDAADRRGQRAGDRELRFPLARSRCPRR